MEMSYAAFERFSFDQGESDILEEKPHLDLDFSKRLLVLQKKGMEIQYQLACLSTLGGAYHLCNHPQTAFVIAIKQEMVGRLLGSHSIIIRSKVFQAVNLSLLGYPKASRRLFQACKRVAAANTWAGMESFVSASELWLRGQKALENGQVTGYIGNTESGSAEHATEHVRSRSSSRGSEGTATD